MNELAVILICALINRFKGGGIVKAPEWMPRKAIATFVIGAITYSYIGNL